MQFTIPAKATVSVRKKARVIEGIDQWPLVSIAKVFAYGLQQLSNDAVASAENDAEIESLFAKRIDNLRAGILRASPIRGSADPVEREAVRIAREMVLKALKKLNVSPKGQDVAGKVTELLAGPKGEGIRNVARANVELAAELGDVEVDLTDVDADDAERGGDEG